MFVVVCGRRSDSLRENVLKQSESSTHYFTRLYEGVAAGRRPTMLLSSASM